MHPCTRASTRSFQPKPPKLWLECACTATGFGDPCGKRAMVPTFARPQTGVRPSTTSVPTDAAPPHVPEMPPAFQPRPLRP
eukprot:1654582-Alexandrium_andersonii.AAC.1